MTYKADFDKELGIASLTHNLTEITVRTLLPDQNRETASIQAYIGARFSRSDKSLVELAKETKVKGNASERLEKIFEGYGHRSVGDQARVMITVENIPDLEAMYLLYLLPDYAAQQRSTRYQDFSETTLPYISLEYREVRTNLEETFSNIFIRQVKTYREMYERLCEDFSKKYPETPDKTIQARALDYARNLLPSGIRTNVAIYASARVLSELISKLRGSKFSVRREIGNTLFFLLKGNFHQEAKELPLWKRLANKIKSESYIPEAWRLIRHAEPDYDYENSLYEINNLFQDEKVKGTYPIRCLDVNCKFNGKYLIDHKPELDDIQSELINRAHSLSNGLKILPLEYRPSLEKIKALTRLVFNHKDKKNLGNFAQIGAIRFDGIASLSILRDINRHRSAEQFYPLLETVSELPNLITSINSIKPFSEILSDNEIEDSYTEALSNGISSARFWYRACLKHSDNKPEVSGFAKHLLPLGTATRYFINCSPEDLIYIAHLRSRSGGDIGYRLLVKDWVEKLCYQNPFYLELYNSLPKIDPKEDFKER